MSRIIESLFNRFSTRVDVKPVDDSLRRKLETSSANLINRYTPISPQEFAEFVTGMINMLGAHQTRGRLDSQPLTDTTNQRYIAFHQYTTGGSVIAFCEFPTTTGLAAVTEYWSDPKVSGEGFTKITSYWQNRKRRQRRVLKEMTLRVASPNEVGLWCREALRTFQELQAQPPAAA